MTDIKTGLWQSTLDGSHINVRRGSTIEPSNVLYSEEGRGIVHKMSARDLFSSYLFRGDSKTNKSVPVIDDTFNDDTPAQTFSALENMAKIICLKCGLDYQLYHNRLSIERDGMCRKCFDEANASKTIPLSSCDFGTDEKCVKVAVCLTCDAKMPEGSEGFEAVNQGLGCISCNSNDDTEAQTFSELGRAIILERAKELPTHIRDRILVELNASAPKPRKHAHYFKNISDFDEMDTYLFCRVWKVKDDSGALHHALKKLMDAGKRGNKDKIKDVTEARDTLNRYLEIEAMFTEVSE